MTLQIHICDKNRRVFANEKSSDFRGKKTKIYIYGIRLPMSDNPLDSERNWIRNDRIYSTP